MTKLSSGIVVPRSYAPSDFGASGSNAAQGLLLISLERFEKVSLVIFGDNTATDQF